MTKRKKAAEPQVSSTMVPSRPAWNASPMLIGYSQPVLAGMVAGLTSDIATFGGEEEYAELDSYLAFRHPEIDHRHRQALTLAILSGAREAAFYAALVRETAVGSQDSRLSHRDADAQLARLQACYGVFLAGGVQRYSDTASVVGAGGSRSGTAVRDTKEMMILDELSSDLGPASSRRWTVSYRRHSWEEETAAEDGERRERDSHPHRRASRCCCHPSSCPGAALRRL